MTTPAEGTVRPELRTWAQMVQRTLDQFPEVRWDRWVPWHSGASVYGWISREDGRSDFLAIEFSMHTPTNFLTSSVLHHETFASRLGVALDERSVCRRVTELAAFALGEVPAAVRKLKAEEVEVCAACAHPEDEHGFATDEFPSGCLHADGGENGSIAEHCTCPAFERADRDQ